jgi:hypothetical protein
MSQGGGGGASKQEPWRKVEVNANANRLRKLPKPKNRMGLCELAADRQWNEGRVC